MTRACSGKGTVNININLSPVLENEISFPATGCVPLNCILSKLFPENSQVPLGSKRVLFVVVYFLSRLETNRISNVEKLAVTFVPSWVTDPPSATTQLAFPLSVNSPMAISSGDSCGSGFSSLQDTMLKTRNWTNRIRNVFLIMSGIRIG